MSALQYLLFLVLCRISSTYKTSPTPWFCTDPNALDPTTEISRTLPSCLPGYAIDIEDVVYESTIDGTCSGSRLCSLNNKNALTFACNHKRSCNVDIRHFRFHINSTCGSTVRFFTQYRCLPVIHEQKDYLCESPTVRRASHGDINLSCERSYRLHITMALIGISVKPQDGTSKARFKCNKDTYWHCNYYIPDAYRNVCNNQADANQCKIRYSDRPALRACQHGPSSNFSLVEYSCIPGEGVLEDLPRIDICSNELSERLPIDRGLLHSPGYPRSIGKHLTCKKQLHVKRESRLRLFMLEKSIEYYHQLNIRLLNTEPNIQRTLAKNEIFDTNITKQQPDEIVEIELKTNHLTGGHFLLYFQVDSRLSEYAPLVLENDRQTVDSHRRGKTLVKRDWGFVIGSIVGLLLVLVLVAIVLIIVRISKRRRAQSLKYLTSGDDDHRQHLNTPSHHTIKPLQIEHPHLLSSSSTVHTSPIGAHLHQHRLNSSLIPSENLSDRESLLKQATRNRSDANPYLEPRSDQERRKGFEGNGSSQPIRDHRENEARYRVPAPLATPEQDKRRLGSSTHDAPMASTETLDVGLNANNREQIKRPKQPPPQVPPPRMDLNHPKPSAPPLPILQSDLPNNENLRAHQRIRQIQQWNQRNPNV